MSHILICRIGNAARSADDTRSKWFYLKSDSLSLWGDMGKTGNSELHIKDYQMKIIDHLNEEGSFVVSGIVGGTDSGQDIEPMDFSLEQSTHSKKENETESTKNETPMDSSPEKVASPLKELLQNVQPEPNSVKENIKEGKNLNI
jgi:hypothetical protein